MEKLDEKRYAYKCLESIAQNSRYYIPSRINRGLLEIVGRALRTVKDRRKLYSLLRKLSKDIEKWDYKLLIEKNDVYRKSQYVENIKEQAINYLRKLDTETPARESNSGPLEEGVCPADGSPTRPLPDDYLDLSNVPKLKNGMISFAPDDGQAIKLSLREGEGSSIPLHRPVEDTQINVSFKGRKCVLCSLKVLKEDENEPKKRSDWEWIDFSFSLPDIVSMQGSKGVGGGDASPHFCTSAQLASPDLRLDIIGGKLTPVIDLKIKVEEKEKKDSPFFLTVDWGLNKLVTICVFNSDGREQKGFTDSSAKPSALSAFKGEQISQPFFLKCDAIQKKLFRIREEIDNLRAKRDKLPSCSTLALWYNREIAKKWNKYRAIQKQLSHLASNVIVEIAKIYNCSKIYVEWLGSLKSRKKSSTLNWKINSQVRQQIYEKVEYKASLAGITLERPINPAFTSQFCPKCGKRGYHVKASDRLNERKKSGGWFYCPACGYNADRDYVACQNIARKALYGNKLKGMSKTFAYRAKAVSDKLFRQSISLCERLWHNLNGWKNIVFLRPIYLVVGTLRL